MLTLDVRPMLMVILLGFLYRAAGESGKIDLRPKIKGGNVVKDQSRVPYQAYIRSKKDQMLFRGAAVLTDRHVVTAAHAIKMYNGLKDLAEIEVIAGTLTLLASANPGPRVRKVVKLIPHPSYRFPDNDIAVLEIESFGTLNNLVNKIEVAKQGIPAGRWGTVAGWGQTAGNAPISYDLRIVEVQFLSIDECKKIYHPRNLNWNEKVCVKYDYANTPDVGDGGGILVYQDQAYGVYVMYEPNLPRIFVNLRYHATWLSSFKESENIPMLPDEQSPGGQPPGGQPPAIQPAGGQSPGGQSPQKPEPPPKENTPKKKPLPQQTSSEKKVSAYIRPVYIVAFFVFVVVFQ